MQPVARPTLTSLARQWDAVAQQRFNQISHGIDLTYDHVLVPAVLQLAELGDWSRVVDVGCGTGTLTEHLAERAGSIVGVDVSKESIRIAHASSAVANASYVHDSVEHFATTRRGASFTLAIANMTLMTAPRLSRFVGAVRSLLRSRALFVFTISHPWFWPSYWGYDTEEWFHYSREIAIEGPFRITLDTTDKTTTHFHRPLAQYASALVAAGFVIDLIAEPLPSASVARRYPQQWKAPRILAVRCVAGR